MDNMLIGRGSRAEQAAIRSAQRHPAGKHKAPLTHRLPDGSLRKCLDCELPFHPRRPIPDDSLCRPCRTERRRKAALALFEADDLE